MRVILVTHGKVNPNGHNGISRVVYNLNKYEKQAGIQSEIWSVVDGIKEEMTIDRGKGVQVKCFPRIKNVLSISSQICKAMEEEKESIDLVHFHMPWMMDKLAIARMCNQCNIPYIVTGHSAYSANQKQSWKMKLGKRYEIPFLNKAAAIHAITREESSEFKKFGIKSDVFVIPNSIEDNSQKVIRAKKDSSQIIFLFMGELREQKNLAALIRAISFLEKKYKEMIKMYIVGPDSRGNMKRLKDLAYKLEVQENIEFTGGIFGEERNKYFEEADVYITPSLSEVISLSAIEAMSYGIPQIATRQSDVSYFYNENFFVMCENYAQDIARAIQEMLDRKEEWEEMSKNARRTYEKYFTWESNIVRFQREYQKIIDKVNKR